MTAYPESPLLLRPGLISIPYLCHPSPNTADATGIDKTRAGLGRTEGDMRFNGGINASTHLQPFLYLPSDKAFLAFC